MDATTTLSAADRTLVSVDRVRKVYPKGSGEDVLVLDDVCLTLGRNEIVSFLGRSGCGKTTLLRILAGLMPATGGEVRIAGRSVVGPSPEVAKVFAELKAEIARLQQEFGDDGLYADPDTWPKGGADGPFGEKQPLGRKTVAEAIAVAAP